MAWYPDAAANLIAGAEYLGSEPGGWLRYLIDSGHDEAWTGAANGVFAVRLTGIVLGGAGSMPAAGNFGTDFDLDATVTIGAPAFVQGASPNLGTDPKGRAADYVRLYILLRVRPSASVMTDNVRIDSLSWTIYRIT